MINFTVYEPIAEDVLELNAYICAEDSNPFHCYGIGKVESAIHSAFYPGSAPFVHGGIAKIAGALCFYLLKSHAFMDGNKRTAAIAATLFMNKHGWDLVYPFDVEQDTNALADIIDSCAASKVDKEQLIEWFENHKRVLED
jgi:death-on-curing protein